MEIIEKSSCITFYSVNTGYFDKFNEVICENSTNMYWQTAPSNSNTLVYHIHFEAKDYKSGELFIEYKSRMHCTVIIENKEQDARQLLTFVDGFHAEMNSFIKNNSLSHFSKLRLEKYQVTEYDLSKMEEGIVRLEKMVKHEDKSEIQKKREKDGENIEVKVEVIKIKRN